MDDIQKEAVHPLEAMGISGEVVQAFNWMGCLLYTSDAADDV